MRIQLSSSLIFPLDQESGRQGTAPSLKLFQQERFDQRFSDLVAGSKWGMTIEFNRPTNRLSAALEKYPYRTLLKDLQGQLAINMRIAAVMGNANEQGQLPRRE